MRRLAAIIVLGLVTFSTCGLGLAANGVVMDTDHPIATCESKNLPPRVERLLKPVLLALAARIRSGEEWDTAYERAFYRLLERKGPDAREAQVALMAYYTGEHYGEELLELARAHPSQFDALVRSYRECRPKVTFEDQLTGVVVLRTLYMIYEGDIDLRK
jgi:hypothetical protein